MSHLLTVKYTQETNVQFCHIRNFKLFQLNGVKLSQKFTGMNVLIHGVGFCYRVSYLTFVKIQFKMVRAFLMYVLHHHVPRDTQENQGTQS